MKSQSALEFMTIVSVGLLLLVIASYFGFDYVNTYSRDINSLNARQMSNNIASAINLVYSQGVGARTKVSFTVPDNIVPNRTYASGREINIRFGDPPSDAVSFPAVEVYGVLPIRGGSNTLFVEMREYGAELRIEDTPSFIRVLTYNDSSRENEDINFTTGETVYYSVFVEDFEENLIEREILVDVYRPNTSLSSLGIIGNSTGGTLNDSFVFGAGSDKGYWLISASEKETELVSTMLVYLN